MHAIDLAVKDIYSVSHYNCIDLAVANALTYLGEDYYTFYCALLGIEANWGEKDPDRDWIMGVLGIKSEKIQCSDKKVFVKRICKQIDKGMPVLMTPMANTVFYSLFYKDTDYPGGHGLIIYGYDENKEIFLTKENIHVTEYNKVSSNGTPFYTFALTFSQLYEIYKNSIIQMEDKAILFYYEKSEKGKSICTSDLLSILSGIDVIKQNQLITSMSDLYNRKVEAHDETIPIYVRRAHVNSLRALIQLYEQYIGKLSMNQMEKDERIKKLQLYVKQREKQVNLIMKLLLSNKLYDYGRFDSLVSEIIENDLQFQGLIREAAKVKNRKRSEKDFARNCRVTADTYRKFPQDYPPENAVNGIWSSGNENECWFSTAFSSEHWMLFDLRQIHKIQRIVLRHYEGKYGRGHLTDFNIESSEDGKSYRNIISVENNQDIINEYVFEGLKCRWIRLVITGTADVDGLSALLEFEAWGEGN